MEEVRDSAEDRHRKRESGIPQRPSCTARAAVAHDGNDHEGSQRQDGWKHRVKKVIRDVLWRDGVVEHRAEKESSQRKGRKGRATQEAGLGRHLLLAHRPIAGVARAPSGEPACGKRHPTTDTEHVSRPASQHRPWWFFLLGFWRTIPILFAIALGFAIGAPSVGALVGLAFLVSSFGFSRWTRANQSRLDEDHLMMRAFTFYFAALGGLLVLVIAGWVIAKQT